MSEVRNVAESRMAMEGQQNAGGIRKMDENGKPFYDQAPLSEYPRMLYRATDQEHTQEHAEAIEGLKDKPMVINRFDGLLCDTCIADSASEAEDLAADGWDVSPKAAHGVADGLGKAVTAKDEEIAALKAQLADAVRKKGGRPRKDAAEPADEPDAGHEE